MAAGLGFKDFTTGEVLTAADVDGYLMQGVWVFASAAARDAAVTSPQEGNFAYLKDTNVTTYYTGSAWANLDTTGMTNPMTTTGDTIYSSSGSTPARLGIGSTGQVLTVAAGIPSWATPASGGGMTLINTGGTALSGASTTISTIPGTYNDLVIYVVDFYASSDFGFYLLINGDSTGANYQQFVNRGTGSSNGAFVDNATNGMDFTGYAVDSPDNNNFAYCYIPNYANSSSRKVANSLTGFIQTTGAKAVCNNNTYYAGSTLNITSLEFKTTVGTWSGGTVYVYGVK